MQAVILGLKGTALKPEEVQFFKDVNPWGFILFKRNVDTPEQVKRLTAELRAITGRKDTPILIDQEGGRVQRLGPPHWPAYLPAKRFLEICKGDVEAARGLVRQSARLMAHDLYELGINVDCLPVLDVPVAGAHDIIGNRAYSLNPEEVAILARGASEAMLAGSVLPVIKHIPGHGRAGADSHEALPIVTTSRAKLEKTDFLPFRCLADMPLAMTAHVVYTAIDDKAPATTSRKMIGSVIRKKIGFSGLIMSDDLSMKALSGSFKERCEAVYAAGCDMALHCNGEMHEMQAVVSGVRKLSGKALSRANQALQLIKHQPEPLDVKAARARLAQACG